MIGRNIQGKLISALKGSPVVFLSGARQTGKSTLIRSMVEDAYPAAYITFDEVGMLSAARADPKGFVSGLSTPVAIDEAQRAPEIFLPLKAEIDRSRTAGKYILTGSANVLFLPRLADALAGRMEVLTLWPFSQGELDGVKDKFVDAVFSDRFPSMTLPSLDRPKLIDRIVRGGYPEAMTPKAADRMNSWFGSYVTTILQRDVRDLARIEGLTALPRLLSILAARASSLLNIAELSSSAAIPQTTLKRYLTLLETTFLIALLPSWTSSRSQRLIKSPKVLLCDTGLLAYLLGADAGELGKGNSFLGQLLENFVGMELIKQISWNTTNAQIFHFRTLRGQEVDILLEDRKGRVAGIEVKASATPDSSDFRNLKILAEIAGRKFHRGIVLYTGADVIPFGRELYAVPIHALWHPMESQHT